MYFHPSFPKWKNSLLLVVCTRPNMCCPNLAQRKTPIFDWANAQSGLFIKTDSTVLAKASQLIAKYPLLTDPSSLRPVQADPYVVALGTANGWVVVTQETYAKTKISGKRKQRTYIPDVCSAENIRCIDFLEMMRQEKWTF